MAETVLKWGFLTAFFNFLWLSLEYLAGIQTNYIAYHPVVTLLALMIPLLCLYYGLREIKQASPQDFGFSKALFAGLCISGIAALFAIVGQWAFHTWVNPRFFSSMITYSESRALAQGVDLLIARQQAEAYYTLESYLLQAVGGALIGGAVISAILAIFMRRH